MANEYPDPATEQWAGDLLDDAIVARADGVAVVTFPEAGFRGDPTAGTGEPIQVFGVEVGTVLDAGRTDGGDVVVLADTSGGDLDGE